MSTACKGFILTGGSNSFEILNTVVLSFVQLCGKNTIFNKNAHPFKNPTLSSIGTNYCFFVSFTNDREQKRRNRMFIPEGELFCLPPHDKVYSDAYAIGQNWDISNGRPETSDDAWREYQKEKK